MKRRIKKKTASVFGMEIEDYVLTATKKEAARMERPLEKKWLDFFWRFMVLCLMLLAVRVVFLTVAKGEYYRKIAKGNSVRDVVIKAPRGRIFEIHRYR